LLQPEPFGENGKPEPKESWFLNLVSDLEKTRTRSVRRCLRKSLDCIEPEWRKKWLKKRKKH